MLGYFSPKLVGKAANFIKAHHPIFDLSKMLLPIFNGYSDKVESVVSVIPPFCTDAFGSIFIVIFFHSILIVILYIDALNCEIPQV